MTMQDPIADLCTRIRNAQAVNKESITLFSSKLKKAILTILHKEGFTDSFEEYHEGKIPYLKVGLKYHAVDGKKKPVINMIKKMSRPGLRSYHGKLDLPHVPGFGIAIVSTSKGVMSAKQAKNDGLGGELICIVN